jgi:hypothetical protein
MDWDHITAADLLKVFDAFKPPQSVIRNVRIYVSEFGKERLARERTEGPPAELFTAVTQSKNSNDSDYSESENDDEEEMGDDEVMDLFKDDGQEMVRNEALRKYQIERMKYYYAVVECDSIAAAKVIYDLCDGTEFEHSSLHFDLRYIPDDVTFDDEPHDEATEVKVHYKPKDFVTTALQDSKVKLAWDEDDAERLRVTRHKFTKDDLKSMDFKTYLASDEDDDSGSEQDDKEEMRQKYKALLAGGSDGSDNEQDGDEKEEEQGDLEITFAPGLSEKASSLLDQRKEKQEQEGETVFEAYLRKQKEKRKAKKAQRKGIESDDENMEADGDGLTTAEMNDPFFQDAFDDVEFGEAVKSESKSSKKKSGKKESRKAGKKSIGGDDEAEQPKDAELELLLMEDNPDRMALSKHHFDMDKKNKKSKKKRAKEDEDQRQDEFEVNLEDERFKAVLTESQFAIDPTSSKFNKTPAMLKVVEARQKKRQRKDIMAQQDVEASGQASDNVADLMSLVNKIKAKAPPSTFTQSFGSRKNNKKPRGA